MKKERKSSPWWHPAIFIFAKMTGWVAIPVVVATYLGKYLDGKYKTEPWLFLLSVGAAFLFSMIGMVRNAVSEMKKIEEEGKKDEKVKE